jgi:hypothetical protein
MVPPTAPPPGRGRPGRAPAAGGHVLLGAGRAGASCRRDENVAAQGRKRRGAGTKASVVGTDELRCGDGPGAALGARSSFGPLPQMRSSLGPVGGPQVDRGLAARAKGRPRPRGTRAKCRLPHDAAGQRSTTRAARRDGPTPRLLERRGGPSLQLSERRGGLIPSASFEARCIRARHSRAAPPRPGGRRRGGNQVEEASATGGMVGPGGDRTRQARARPSLPTRSTPVPCRPGHPGPRPELYRCVSPSANFPSRPTYPSLPPTIT